MPADDVYENAIPAMIEACRVKAKEISNNIAQDMTNRQSTAWRTQMSETDYCSGTDVRMYTLIADELCNTHGFFVSCDPRVTELGKDEFANTKLFNVTVIALHKRVRIEQHPACVCPVPEDTTVETTFK
jgi:hypothetical protein